MLYSIRHLVNINSIDNKLNEMMMFNLFLIKTCYLKCLLYMCFLIYKSRRYRFPGYKIKMLY